MEKEMKYQLTVIIPVFNTMEYLKKCLDSIVNQTLKEIEIIVVDDASTQDIYSFLKREYPKAESIKYIRNNQSLKPGGARNKGIKIAQGKYIAFCDSDDWLDLNTYKTSIEYMEKADADIGMISMIREHYSPSVPSAYKCKYSELVELTSDMCIRILSRQYQNGIQIIPHCFNKIYKKDFIDSNHLLFEENIYFQGLLFTVKSFLYTNNIICIPNANYHHFYRSNSVIQSFDIEHIRAYEVCFSILKEYFVNTGTKDKYLFNYYQMAEMYLYVIIAEIFRYIPSEQERKEQLKNVINVIKRTININEYFEFASSDEIKSHILPYLDDYSKVLF